VLAGILTMREVAMNNTLMAKICHHSGFLAMTSLSANVIHENRQDDTELFRRSVKNQ